MEKLVKVKLTKKEVKQAIVDYIAKTQVSVPEGNPALTFHIDFHIASGPSGPNGEITATYKADKGWCK